MPRKIRELCLRKSETNSGLAEDSSRQGCATEAATVAVPEENKVTFGGYSERSPRGRMRVRRDEMFRIFQRSSDPTH